MRLKMQNKDEQTDLYIKLVEAIIMYKNEKKKERYKKVLKHLEKNWTDVKLTVISNKKEGVIEKFVLALIDVLKTKDIKYMEAVKERGYVWIAYRAS
jgi:predicted HAD superfamily phosphohydrolase YqeG